MEVSESEAVFNSPNLNPQLFINEALNAVDDLVDDAFEFHLQQDSTLLKTKGTDRSQDLSKAGKEYSELQKQPSSSDHCFGLARKALQLYEENSMDDMFQELVHRRATLSR